MARCGRAAAPYAAAVSAARTMRGFVDDPSTYSEFQRAIVTLSDKSGCIQRLAHLHEPDHDAKGGGAARGGGEEEHAHLGEAAAAPR